MKKQCKVFALAKKKPTLAKDDAHVGTQVNLTANAWFVSIDIKHDRKPMV
jgi:hypothetical protein